MGWKRVENTEQSLSVLVNHAARIRADERQIIHLYDEATWEAVLVWILLCYGASSLLSLK